MTDQWGFIHAVDERPLGTELTAAADPGDTVLEVEKVSDFTEGGQLSIGAEIHTVSDIDPEAGTVTVEDPLAGPHAVETQVLVYPEKPLRVAYVAIDAEPEGMVAATVQFSQKDRLPLGVRAPDDREEALVRRNNFGGWELVDVRYRTPTIDLLYAEQPVADGAAPPDPPSAPTIQRVPKGNIVDMSAYARPDDWKSMLVEFAVSEDSGATWSAWEALGATGTVVIHGGLEYPTTEPGDDGHPDVVYKYRFQVLDIEGLTSGYSPESIPAAAAKVNDGGSADIEVRSIIGAYFQSTVVLSSLFTTRVDENGTPSPNEQGLEWDQSGIRGYAKDANGNAVLVLDIPTVENGEAYFKGYLDTLGITAHGLSSFEDHVHFEPGSEVHLHKGISAPVSAPSVEVYWDAQEFFGVQTLDDSECGIYHDPAGGPAGNTPSMLIGAYRFGRITVGHTPMVVYEFAWPAGTLTRSFAVAQSTGATWNEEPRGVARLGAHIFLLTRDSSTETSYLYKYLQSDLSFVSRHDISAMVVSGGHPCLGADPADTDGGTYPNGRLLLGTTTAATGGKFRLRKIDPATVTSTQVISSSTGVGMGDSTPLTGVVKAEGRYWVGRVNSSSVDVLSYSDTTLTDDADQRFPASEAVYGVAHDGTRFWTRRSGDNRLTKHTNWKWTSETDKYWVGYTWYDSVGGYETKLGLVTSRTMTKRAKMKVTATGAFPNQADSVRFYMDRKATTPTDAEYNRQGAFQPDGVIELEDFDTDDPAPPAATSFPESAAAKVSNKDGTKLFDADSHEPFWQELKRASLAAEADVITIDNIPTRKYLKLLIHIVGVNTWNAHLRFNNDGGNNYSRRRAIDMGAASPFTSESSWRFLVDNQTGGSAFIEVVITNPLTRAKFGKARAEHGNDAATAAPNTLDSRGKWANVAAQITRVDVINDNTGGLGAGSEIVVLGHD